MLKRNIFYKLLLAGAVATLAGGCGKGGNNSGRNTTSSTHGASSSSNELTVRIAYSPNIVLPQPMLLKEMPAYSKFAPRLNFVYTAYPAGPAVIEALRAGQADVGYSGIFPPLKAFLKAGDIQLVAGAATGGTQLMVSAKSPYKTIKDLKGKIIGVNQIGSTVDALVRGAIIAAGMVPEQDVRIVPVDPAQQADALKRGDVAAVAAPAPWPSQVQLSGGRALLDWKAIFDNGNYAAGVLFTSRDFATKHPALLKQYAALHRAINAALNKNRVKGNADVIAWSFETRKKLSPAVAKAAFATIKFTDNPDLPGVTRMADLALKTGISKSKGNLTGFVVNTK